MTKMIKVAGIEYTVVEREEVIIDGSSLYVGSCSYAGAEIEIKSGISEQRKKEVLAHELLHAMLFEAGYSVHDEELVERLGKVLSQVLQDNEDILQP